MKLAALLNPLLFRRLEARSKREALQELVQHLVTVEHLPLEREIWLAIEERQRLGAFSMGKGIAYPHARLDEINRIYVSVGVSPQGVDFEAADGAPVRVIVLFVIPKPQTHLYLQLIAAFSGILVNPFHVQNILQATDTHEIYDYIHDMGIRIATAATLKDVVAPCPPSVRADAPFRESVETLCEHVADSLPVVDADGKLIGELRAMDILKLGVKDYVGSVADGTSIAPLEPFEEFFQMHADACVRDLMLAPAFFLPVEMTLLEASVRLLSSRQPAAFVVRQGKPIGLIHTGELVRKFLNLQSAVFGDRPARARP